MIFEYVTRPFTLARICLIKVNLFCHGPCRRLKAMAMAPPKGTLFTSNEQTRTNMSVLACRHEQSCLLEIVFCLY